MAPQRLSEFDLIETYFAPLAAPGGLGLKDDAALLHVPAGHDLVTTVDAIVEGVHFLPDDPPATIGWKALGVNVSDLAAKGADPLGYLLTLALPAGFEPAWLQELADGLGRAAGLWSCPLLGGDTVKMPGPLTLSITAFGAVPKGQMVLRNAAKPGDILAITGTIGDGALGLAIAQKDQGVMVGLSAADRAYLVDRYRRPRPRIQLSRAVRAHAHAAMDISDGLMGDAAKMLSGSGQGGLVETAAIPLSEPARHALSADPTLLQRVLTGGDDYEILCAVDPTRWDSLSAEAAALAIPLTRIGRVAEGSGLTIMGAEGPLSWTSLSYNHFA